MLRYYSEVCDLKVMGNARSKIDEENNKFCEIKLTCVRSIQIELEIMK